MRRSAPSLINLGALKLRPYPSTPRRYQCAGLHSTPDGDHGDATAPQAQKEPQLIPVNTDNEPAIEDLFNFDGTWTEVDPDSKTIETAVGPLPVSPLMDPTWRKAKRTDQKKRQPPPVTRMGRFQRLLKQNPYAQMLAEPVRTCQVTKTRLPKPFLQGFGLVKHPEGDELWWMPAGFEQPPKATAGEAAVEGNAQALSEDGAPRGVEHVSDESPDAEEPTERSGQFQAPAHALARQDLLQEFNTKDLKHSGGHFRFAAIPSIGSKAARAVWRRDMDDVLRETMRRGVVDALIHASQGLDKEVEGRVTLIKLDRVADSLKYQNRVCFLLLSGEYTPFDYLEAPGVPGSARPAYHLPELLGPEHLQRLDNDAPPFRDGPLLLLKGKGNMNVTKRLWGLQSFLADYKKLKSKRATNIDERSHA